MQKLLFREECDLCDFKTKSHKEDLVKMQLKRHKEGVHKLGTKYECGRAFCDFVTYRKADYIRHKRTKKHKPMKR